MEGQTQVKPGRGRRDQAGTDEIYDAGTESVKNCTAESPFMALRLQCLALMFSPYTNNWSEGWNIARQSATPIAFLISCSIVCSSSGW
jgi:hypothetical protein